MDSYKRHYNYNVLGIVLFVGLLSLFFVTEDYGLTANAAVDTQEEISQTSQIDCNNLRLDIVETYNRINELIKQGKRYDTELQRLYVRLIDWSESCMVHDTDGDKLDDWIEREITKTDLNKADTDGGGRTDGEETLKIPGIRGREGPTNPLDPKDDAPQQTSFAGPQITPYPIAIGEDQCIPETQILLTARENLNDATMRLETEQGQLIASSKANPNSKGGLTAIIPRTCGISLTQNSQLIMIILRANIQIARTALKTQQKILPEPLPPFGGDSWSFLPEYEPGKPIYEGTNIEVEESPPGTLEQVKEFVKLPFQIIINLFNLALTPLPGGTIEEPPKPSINVDKLCGNSAVDRTWNDDFGRWEGEQCDPPRSRCSKEYNLPSTKNYPEGVFTICGDQCQCDIDPRNSEGFITTFPFGNDPVCGDGVINQKSEQCDTNNIMKGYEQCLTHFGFKGKTEISPADIVFPIHYSVSCTNTCTCEKELNPEKLVSSCGCSDEENVVCFVSNSRGKDLGSYKFNINDLEINKNNCGCKSLFEPFNIDGVPALFNREETKEYTAKDFKDPTKINSMTYNLLLFREIAEDLFRLQNAPCKQPSDVIINYECPPGQYLVAPGQCCPIGTVLQNNQCVQKDDASLPPTLPNGGKIPAQPPIQQPPVAPPTQQPPSQPPAQQPPSDQTSIPMKIQTYETYAEASNMELFQRDGVLAGSHPYKEGFMAIIKTSCVDETQVSQGFFCPQEFKESCTRGCHPQDNQNYCLDCVMRVVEVEQMPPE